MKTRTLELTLFCLALSACGEPSGQVAIDTTRSALSGGPAISGEGEPYDAMLKLVSTNNGRISPSTAVCSATLITPTRVLTSAKCLSDNAFSPERVCITSRILDNRCDPGAPVSEHYYIRKTHVHSSFTGVVGSGFDAAIVQFERPITHFSGSGILSIAPLPIDDQVFPDDFQGTIYGFGNNTEHPTFSGMKQMWSDLVSVSSPFPNYIALQTVTLLPGDFGGGFISGFNQLAGINSFVQNGLSLLTRTQPIRAWIQNPPLTPLFPSIPNCTLSGKFIYSVIAGKCMEPTGTNGVSLNYCQCKSSQRFFAKPSESFNTLSDSGSFSGGRCLTGHPEGVAPTFDACSGNNISQQWQITGGTGTTQLTSRNGLTLLTKTMNATVMGISSQPMRLWTLK